MRREANISLEAWTPSGQVESEQNHARAIDNLREADVFFVVTGNLRDGGHVKVEVICGGAADDVMFRHVLVAAANDSRRFRELIDEHTGETA